MRRKLTSMSCDFCGWLRWRTRTSPPTKSCSRTCNPDSRAGAPAKAIFSRLSSASRPPRQRGKNFVGDWTTPARSIAGSLVLKRSIFAFPLRFEGRGEGDGAGLGRDRGRGIGTRRLAAASRKAGLEYLRLRAARARDLDAARSRIRHRDGQCRARQIVVAVLYRIGEDVG